jgi:hypothetical protein
MTQASPVRYDRDSANVFAEKQVTRADNSVVKLTNQNGKPIGFDTNKQRGCSDHFAIFVSVEV